MRPPTARSQFVRPCCGGMVSRTTTASQGVLCPSVYGLVCRTFAMSVILPVIRLRWPRSALQSPFEVSFATAPAVACTALDTRRMRWPPHRRRCALFRAPGRPNAEKRIKPASMLLAPYFLPSCFCSGLLVVIGAAQTVLMRAMPTTLPHLRERYSRCRDRREM